MRCVSDPGLKPATLRAEPQLPDTTRFKDTICLLKRFDHTISELEFAVDLYRFLVEMLPNMLHHDLLDRTVVPLPGKPVEIVVLVRLRFVNINIHIVIANVSTTSEIKLHIDMVPCCLCLVATNSRTSLVHLAVPNALQRWMAIF